MLKKRTPSEMIASSRLCAACLREDKVNESSNNDVLDRMFETPLLDATKKTHHDFEELDVSHDKNVKTARHAKET